MRALLSLFLATRVALTMSLHQGSEREDSSIKKYNPGVTRVVTKKSMSGTEGTQFSSVQSLSHVRLFATP